MSDALLIFNLKEINFAEKSISLIVAVIQAIIIFVLTKVLLDKTFKEQRSIGKNLQDYGIEKVRVNKGGTLSKNARDVVFGLNGKQYPTSMDLCFISGNGFFRDFQLKIGYIKKLLENNCKIRVLLANPYSGTFGETPLNRYADEQFQETLVNYYYDILTNEKRAASFLERAYVMLIKSKVQDKNGIKKDELRKLLNVKFLKNGTTQNDGDHGFQVKHIESMCKELKKSGDIELRFYEDEYQMPIILVKSYIDEKQKDKNEENILLWTNINAPIRETSESINVFCKSDSDDLENKKFVNDVCNSFEYLWDTYAPNASQNNKKEIENEETTAIG